jgi:hypothetical protein
MPAAANAVFGKNSVFTFDDDPYQGEISKARFVPAQETQAYKVLVPTGTQSDSDNPTWMLEITGLQIHAAGGLAAAMRAAAGTTVEVMLQPVAGFSKPTGTADIIVPAVPFGVEQGTWETMDLQCPVVGEPTWGTSAAS